MILILAGEGDSTRIVYHYLSKSFDNIEVVIEQSIPRKTMIRNRIKKLGILRVASQLAFMVGFRPIMANLFGARIEEIINDQGLDRSPIPVDALHRVSSVNSPECIDLIRGKQPKVIVVNGTRIIAKRVLESTRVPFINTHAGITPEYRGVHGGYWALYEGKLDRCGVTVHLVDPGVDTGEIIGQALISPTKSDGFPTYPYLQIAAALDLLQDAVQSGLEGKIITRPSGGRSKIWYHPGIFQYLTGTLRGVK